MIIFLLLVISIPFVQSTYNSTITKIKSPCIYGYHFKVLDNQTSVTECYTFDQNELVVEGKSLNLGIYISKKYITTHKTSRCGECLEMTSTGGIMYKVMINDIIIIQMNILFMEVDQYLINYQQFPMVYQ